MSGCRDTNSFQRLGKNSNAAPRQPTKTVWKIFGYLLIFGAGTQFFATMLSTLTYSYAALEIMKIQPTLLGNILFLIYGLSFAGFKVWLGIKLVEGKL